MALLAAVLVIFWHGDRELDALDFVLSEFHLGATYDAIIRRQLWRTRGIDVLLVPLLIIALAYALSGDSQTILLTSIAMYAAVWHRGRQSLGVARFYQRGNGGPASPTHHILFRGAIYLPMLAAMLAYTHLEPAEYEGQPYLSLNFGAATTWTVALAAAVWVVAYLSWTLRRGSNERLEMAPGKRKLPVHPGEIWVVLANGVAFGSSYVLGAANASFLLVLAVHHEIQYLYFAYAMARRSGGFPAAQRSRTARIAQDANMFCAARGRLSEAKSMASFLVWPVIGFNGAIVGGWLNLSWLRPLGVGGLFCHYWLDGRIWIRRPV